jgi:lipoprotein NlpD
MRSEKIIFNNMNKAVSVFLSLYLCSCSSVDTHQKADIIYARRLSPYYTVEAGDTVASIAKKYDMEESQFIEINKLSMPYELIPGQKVIVHPKVDKLSSTPTKVTESDGVVISQNLEAEKKPLENEPKSANEAEKDKVDGNGKLEVPHEYDEKESTPTEAIKNGLKWPVYGKIVKKFGDKKNGQFSNGISISAPEGTPVYPAKSGTVTKSDVDLAGFGKTIVVHHDDGMMTIYSHLKICQAKVGQKVTAKTVIGRVGKTGGIKKPELHFQVRSENKEPINPQKLLG